MPEECFELVILSVITIFFFLSNLESKKGKLNFKVDFEGENKYLGAIFNYFLMRG
jgi:hypothetical protein